MSEKKKIKIKRRKQDIYFRGRKYTYTSSLDLSTQLKITKEDTERLIKDVNEGRTRRLIQSGTDIGRYDIRRRPLLFRLCIGYYLLE